MSPMASLSSGHQDALIFAGLAATAMAMAVMLHHSLKELHSEAKIKPVQPKAKYITQDTEDALTVSTLEGLLGHYNPAIREMAAKIVCDRVVNDEAAIELLLYGITRPDYDERLKNLRALAVITDPYSINMLHTWKAYTALVRSLELCVDPKHGVLPADMRWDEYPLFDEFPLRDMAEKLPLMFICQLLPRGDPEMLIKAKFVEKWLAKQDWGGETDKERHRNFSDYLEKRNRISDIVIAINNVRAGREALFKAGLISEAVLAPNSVTVHNDDQNDHDENDGPTDERMFTLFNVLREVNDSASDRLRRNREAMVFSDGSHPLNPSDIIQRDLE